MSIWGERKVSSKSVSDAQEHLNYLQIKVTEGEEKISVKTVQPNQSNGRSYVVDYYIYLPPNWNLMVIQVNRRIEVNNSTGETSVQNVNGNIQLNNINGNIVCSLVNGSIIVSDLVLNNMSNSAQKISGTLGTGDGDIDISSVNGTIDVCGF